MTAMDARGSRRPGSQPIRSRGRHQRPTPIPRLPNPGIPERFIRSGWGGCALILLATLLGAPLLAAAGWAVTR